MKNFFITLMACIASFALTSFGLNKYGENLLPKQASKKEATKTKKKAKKQSAKTPDKTQNKEVSTEKAKKSYTLNINPSTLESDYKTWTKYNKENIELAYEFTPIDVDGEAIEKEDFLDKLKTGLYIPVKAEDDDFIYQLHKLNPTKVHKKIGKSMRGIASDAYHYFKKEGTALPDFNFVDLDGNEYNKSNTRGKIKVIKCWFINCVVCVQEFPELNDLYDRYESNDDILFMSLAFDKPEKLKKFLAKKEFRYPVIGEQKKYMSKKLEVKQYPTHIIVDEDNNIIKMVNNVKALVTIIDQLVGSEDFTNEVDSIETETL